MEIYIVFSHFEWHILFKGKLNQTQTINMHTLPNKSFVYVNVTHHMLYHNAISKFMGGC